MQPYQLGHYKPMENPWMKVPIPMENPQLVLGKQPPLPKVRQSNQVPRMFVHIDELESEQALVPCTPYVEE